MPLVKKTNLATTLAEATDGISMPSCTGYALRLIFAPILNAAPPALTTLPVRLSTKVSIVNGV